MPTPIAGEAPMQTEAPRIAIPAVPNLVLLPSAASLDQSDSQGRDGERSILGLTLTQRTVMAAGRAGYGRIFALARDCDAPPGTTAMADWSSLADALPPSQAAPLVI